jgi:hypothetical protein
VFLIHIILFPIRSDDKGRKLNTLREGLKKQNTKKQQKAHEGMARRMARRRLAKPGPCRAGACYPMKFACQLLQHLQDKYDPGKKAC